MNITLMHLLVAALATWEIVEIWNHGSIFATQRAILQTKDGFFARLMGCGFCLSPWVAAVVLTLLLVTEPPKAFGSLLQALWGTVLLTVRLFVYAFAVARLANLGNDLTHKHSRTPREKFDAPADQSDAA